MCFRNQKFQHPAIRFCGDLGFLIMPKRPSEWRVDTHGCYKYDNAAHGVTKPLTFLCFSIFPPPTYLAPTASCTANMHNKEDWNAGITNMTVREEDVHDRDLVRQGHVSTFLHTFCGFP